MSILPQDPTDAVKHLIRIAEQLVDIMEKEGRAMTMQDGVSFTAAQEDKTRLADSYHQAAEEFKQRLMDFRSVDRALLDKLDAVQRALLEKSKENMDVMDRLGGSGDVKTG